MRHGQQMIETLVAYVRTAICPKNAARCRLLKLHGLPLLSEKNKTRGSPDAGEVSARSAPPAVAVKTAAAEQQH
jgi:hypothetical protein